MQGGRASAPAQTAKQRPQLAVSKKESKYNTRLRVLDAIGVLHLRARDFAAQEPSTAQGCGDNNGLGNAVTARPRGRRRSRWGFEPGLVPVRRGLGARQRPVRAPGADRPRHRGRRRLRARDRAPQWCCGHRRVFLELKGVVVTCRREQPLRAPRRGCVGAQHLRRMQSRHWLAPGNGPLQGQLLEHPRRVLERGEAWGLKMSERCVQRSELFLVCVWMGDCPCHDIRIRHCPTPLRQDPGLLPHGPASRLSRYGHPDVASCLYCSHDIPRCH